MLMTGRHNSPKKSPHTSVSITAIAYSHATNFRTFLLRKAVSEQFCPQMNSYWIIKVSQKWLANSI